jgi:hypothetical protein
LVYLLQNETKHHFQKYDHKFLQSKRRPKQDTRQHVTVRRAGNLRHRATHLVFYSSGYDPGGACKITQVARIRISDEINDADIRKLASSSRARFKFLAPMPCPCFPGRRVNCTDTGASCHAVRVVRHTGRPRRVRARGRSPNLQAGFPCHARETNQMCVCEQPPVLTPAQPFQLN